MRWMLIKINIPLILKKLFLIMLFNKIYIKSDKLQING